MATAIAIIEQRTAERDYQFAGVDAIISHPMHGRLLICDGFGGMGELRGGAVRWEHGIAIKLHNDDTLDDLYADNYRILARAISGGDDSRPIMPWTGTTISALARNAGL